MAPIPFSGSAEEAVAAIAEVVAAMPRAIIVRRERNYLHAEFRTLVFRFVDDVEFYVDEAEAFIHFRSASRVGRGDFGVNRRRMKSISEALKRRL